MIGRKNMATCGLDCFALYGYMYSENFINLLQKYLYNFQIIRAYVMMNCRNVPWVNFYQIDSSRVDWLKNLAVGVWGCFALYGYSENFKNLLLQKYLANSQIIL